MYVTLKSFHSLIWEETEGPCEKLDEESLQGLGEVEGLPPWSSWSSVLLHIFFSSVLCPL